MDREYVKNIPDKFDYNELDKKYHYLTVLEYLGVFKQRSWVVAECDCGNKKELKLNAIKSGNSKSCGKCKLARPIDSNKYDLIDGKLKQKPTYQSWRAMKERCSNPKSRFYQNYGGRGISYTQCWELFDNFYSDMGERPEGTTLDRIDVNGDYCKENCRWVDATWQRHNSRRRADNSSGRTGVIWNEKLSKWSAIIQHYDESKYLGAFHSFEEAVKAREAAELEILGEVKSYEDI